MSAFWIVSVIDHRPYYWLNICEKLVSFVEISMRFIGRYINMLVVRTKKDQMIFSWRGIRLKLRNAV